MILKKNILLATAILSILIVRLSFAETVKLKDGRIFEGLIIERSQDYIVLQCRKVPLKYHFDQIDSIDGQAPSSAAPKDRGSLQGDASNKEVLPAAPPKKGPADKAFSNPQIKSALDQYEAIVDKYAGVLKTTNNPAVFKAQAEKLNNAVAAWQKSWDSILSKVDPAEIGKVQGRLNNINQKLSGISRCNLKRDCKK